MEKLYPDRENSLSSSGPFRSEGTLSSVDTRTPSELRVIPFVSTPGDFALPSFTTSPVQLKRKPSRLPVIKVNFGGAVKVVAGGHRLLTAAHQMNVAIDMVNALKYNSVTPLLQPPAASKRNPAKEKRSQTPSLKPNSSTKGRSIKTINRLKKINRGSNLQKVDSEDHEVLQPLTNPAASLSQCTILLSTDNWKQKMDGLRCVRALAQHHPNTLMVKLHEVCLAVIEEIKNLRTSVAYNAIDTIKLLHANLQKNMDNEAEITSRALLLKMANASANSLMKKKLTLALEALVHNCSPNRVLPALLNTGLNHRSTAVRASTAQQLHLLADRLGAAAVLTAGQSFTPRFLTAASKMSQDAAAQVRPYGYAIIKELAKHQDFMHLWNQTIPNNDRRWLDKVVNNLVKE